MEKAIKARGETPFNEAGDGIVICFTNADMMRLQESYGTKFVAEFTNELLIQGDINFKKIDDLLTAGLKRDRIPVPQAETKVESIPYVDMVEKLINALHVTVYGLDFPEYTKMVMENLERMKAEGEDPSPSSPDTASSTISEEGASGPESA